MLTIPIRAGWLRRLYLVIGAINAILLGLFALIQAERLRPGLVDVPELDPAYQFSLQNEEGVIAVWYSSTLFLLVGIAALLCYASDHDNRPADGRRRRAFRHGWLLLSAIGVFLSADESSRLHEGIGGLVGTAAGDQLARLGFGGAGPTYAWVLVFAPALLLAVVLLGAFVLYWLSAVPRSRLLAGAGIVCWGLVIVLEVVETRLVRVYGALGVWESQFFEESLEVVGATLLLFAATEYLIAINQQQPAPAPAPAPRSSGRAALALGAAAPLLIFPLLGVAMLFDQELRDRYLGLGYRFTVARVVRVMKTETPSGHYLVLSNQCRPAELAPSYPFDLQVPGPVTAYPPPETRESSPDLVLTVLELVEGTPWDVTAAGLARLASLGTHVWHLQCGPPNETDLRVQDWLREHSVEFERRRFLGEPRLVLTGAVPRVPLGMEALGWEPVAPTPFGAGDIRLLGHQCYLGEPVDAAVLRVMLAWHAEAPIEADYHVFVHLVDGEGRLLAQSDGRPVYDRYPFGVWETGSVVVDPYDLPLPSGISLDEVEIRVGLYELDSGARLPVGSRDYVSLHPRPGLPPP